MTKKCAIIMDNCNVLINLLIDYWNKNICVVLIDYRTPLIRICEILNKCDIDELNVDINLCKIPFLEKIKIKEYDLKYHIYEKIEDNIMDKYHCSYSESDALILFSSGTTGINKGIYLSFKAINLNADNIIKIHGGNYINNLAITRLLVHSSPLVSELLVALKMRITTYVFSTRSMFNLVCRKFDTLNIKTIGLNPTLLRFFLSYMYTNESICRKIKTIFVSGSLVQRNTLELIKKYEKKVNIFVGYGLTEAGPRVTMQNEAFRSYGSSGITLNSVELKIMSNNKECLPFEVGDIYIKTDSKYSRYIDEEINNVNEWIDSKDIGYKNLSNELFVMGRKDDVIISAAHKIIPSSVENIILMHKCILECCVIGIPDEIYVEKIICFYVSNNNIKLDSDILNLCECHLLKYEIPSKFIQVDSIPKTLNNKVDKNKLHSIFESSSNNNCLK